MDPEELNNRSSSASNLTRESTFRSLSPTQSPPIQLMERPEDFEFQDASSSSSSSESEWSSVSNESLFSIHITNSLTHDNDIFQSGESVKSDDLTTFSGPINVESDFESLKIETTSKLDEPQKVVRWKTQVERPAEEGAPPEGHQWQPSPFNNHISNEPTKHTTTKPKKKLWWSCKCNISKWSCWNGCWKNMSCSICKPKKVSSSHSTEGSGPKKPSASKKGPRLRSWSCSCHCCDEVNLA
ncbi:hypothetical protein Lser_V15G14919 [Lactuca serriola]